jgi:hypothetical protein
MFLGGVFTFLMKRVCTNVFAGNNSVEDSGTMMTYKKQMVD